MNSIDFSLLSTMVELEEINFVYVNLTGVISGLSNLVKLKYLNMAHNFLYDPIPDTWTDLVELRSLEL